MKKAASLPLASLSEHIKLAVGALQPAHRELLGHNPEIVFLPQPGIVGYVVPDSTHTLSVADADTLAVAMKNQLGPLASAEKASLLVHDGRIIVGFMPSANVYKL